MGNFRQFLTASTYPLNFVLRLTADGSLATGKTPSVTLSKNGGAFAAADGTVSEIGDGLYTFAFTVLDTATAGELWWHIEATDCTPITEHACDIVGYNAFANVPGLVWEESLFDHLIADTFGEYFSQQIAQIITSRVSHVWDEIPFDHTDPDSFAQILSVNLDAKVSEVPSGVWSHVLEGTKTAAWFMRVMLSALAGKLSGADTDHIKSRDLLDTKDRIDATTTSDGRTSVTLDGD
jgi:hypothetical protein